MEIRTFNVADDEGFLALIDSDGYAGFVDENWDFDQLVTHFQDQMQKRRLLIWGTGAEGIWRVEIHLGPVQTQGFQEIVGSIDISEGWLLLTNYQALITAAMYEDVKLPEPNQYDQYFQIEPGQYQCRIIQLHNHDMDGEDEDSVEDEADFIIELLRDTPLAPVWQSIPWAAI